MTNKYRNKFEARVGATIAEPFRYEAKRLPYTTEHHYLPDFIDVSGKRIIEMKGRFTASDRSKMKAIRQQYPDWEITMVFQNPSTKISKTSSTSYGDWCDKHGILWRKG